LGSDLEFDWDNDNRGHIARHPVTTYEAEEVIRNGPMDIAAETYNGEERFVNLGQTDRGRILVVVTTMRGARIRVITAFPAQQRLVDLYFSLKGSRM